MAAPIEATDAGALSRAPSIFEEISVREPTRRMFLGDLKSFVACADCEGLVLDEVDAVDKTATANTECRFLLEDHAFLAAVMYCKPAHGRNGQQTPPPDGGGVAGGWLALEDRRGAIRCFVGGTGSGSRRPWIRADGLHAAPDAVGIPDIQRGETPQGKPASSHPQRVVVRLDAEFLRGESGTLKSGGSDDSIILGHAWLQFANSVWRLLRRGQLESSM